MKNQIAREEGQQLILFALLLPILIACLGLVVDVGNVYVHRRNAQNAADAAMAAASMVLSEQGVSTASATARTYAAQNGYNNNGTTNIVTLFSPPTSGAYVGDSQYIQIDIQDNVTPIFASVVWNGTFAVHAKATAGYRIAGKGPPLIILNETQCQTLKKTGTGSLRAPNGSIQVNSGCSDAVRIVGSGFIISAFPNTIHGGFSPNPTDLIIPVPITGAPVLPVPLASLPVPNLGSYTVRNGTPSVPKTLNFSDSRTLNPGVYYGGIKITGSSPTILNPGVYIMAGTGFLVTGSGSVTGSNVFFYITEDPSHPTGDGAMGALDLAGSGNLNVTAPTSGPYAGILVFYDRANTNQANVTGSSTWAGLTGVIYLKKAELDLAGSGTIYASFVIDRLTINGSGDLNTYGYSGPGWQSVASFLSE